MKITDTFRVSCHNIRHNLGRTALTTAIVAIVSALVMFLLLIGVSFRENLLTVARYAFSVSGATYTMSGAQVLDFHNNINVGPITEEEYALYKERAEAHREVCGDDVAQTNSLSLLESLNDAFLFFTGNFRGFQDTTTDDGWWVTPPVIYAKSFSSVPAGITFREGRSWTPADSGSNAIFVSREIQRRAENGGHIVHAGDEVLLLNLGKEQQLASFTIEGFFEGDDTPFYIGMDKLFELTSASDSLYVKTISMHFDPPAGAYDYDATYASMKSFTEEMSAALEQDYEMADLPGADIFIMLFSDITRRFVNNFVDQMRLVDVLSSIVIAVFALLAFLVLLLSVGSVANSVIISVDKNKKFFGMMKAVGLNARGLRGLVMSELLLIVTVGVLIGIALLYALFPVANSIIVTLFDYLWSAELLPFAVSALIPVWLPLSTVAFFLLLTMLFARGSIRKIASQDVMVTLSEVA